MRYYVILLTALFFQITTCAGLESISFSDFYNGVVLDSLEIDFITDTLTDSLHNIVYVSDVLCDDSNCFVAYISPNVCGSCERHSLDLINALAKEYPGQVVFIIQNSYFKEAIKSVRSYQFDSDIRIFFDTDGKNIEKFSKLNPKFFNMWQFIIDSRNHVLCMRALDYNHKPTIENYQKYLKEINALLSN